MLRFVLLPETRMDGSMCGPSTAAPRRTQHNLDIFYYFVLT